MLARRSLSVIENVSSGSRKVDRNITEIISGQLAVYEESWPETAQPAVRANLNTALRVFVGLCMSLFSLLKPLKLVFLSSSRKYFPFGRKNEIELINFISLGT